MEGWRGATLNQQPLDEKSPEYRRWQTIAEDVLVTLVGGCSRHELLTLTGKNLFKQKLLNQVEAKIPELAIKQVY